MKKFNKMFKNVSIFVLAIMFVIGFSGPIPARAATTATTPDLGVASTYAILSDTFANTSATTTVTGDIGYTTGPGTVAPGGVNTVFIPAAAAGAAQATALTALNSGTNAACDVTFAAGAIDLGIDHSPQHVGTTYVPGVYCVTGAMSIDTSPITLSGAGTYIFRSTGAFSTSAGMTVTLAGASACDVFWNPNGATTIGANNFFKGTVIPTMAAAHDITVLDSTTWIGRALTFAHAVTFPDLSASISVPTSCSTPTPTPTSSSGGSTPIVYAPVPPLISILKIPTPLALPAGPGSVTYNYSVTNIGTVDMSNVTVTDDSCSSVSFISGDSNGDSKLGANEIWKYRCTSNLAQTTTNIATASGKANGLTAVDTASATVVVGLPLVPPLVHLVKKPNVFVLPAGGGAVTYSYTVTNPGTVPLSNVTITDDKCTGLPGRVVGHPGDLNKNDLLESNETWTFTCQSNLIQTTTNTGTVRGTANGFIATDFALATVVVAAPSLPKTSLPPSPWNPIILVLSGMFLLVSVSFVMVLRKKTN